MDYKEYFRKRKLLTDGKGNTKTAKNSMSTHYLSLQPTDLNTMKVNLCKFATKECRTQCLQYAGRQSFSNVVLSRERKTEWFVTKEKDFLEKLWGELEVLNKGDKCAIRLNLLSDVNWEEKFKGVGKDMKELDNIQFYDYTKDPKKVDVNNLPNYNLTFSFSGGNWQWCEKFLNEKKANIAVVFKGELPKKYKGFTVVDGDKSDERFLDKKGVIVGLKYKKAKGVPYVSNKFVIDEI